jgi:hypothetical protein
MVDIVVNNVAATTIAPDYSRYYFREPVSVSETEQTRINGHVLLAP